MGRWSVGRWVSVRRSVGRWSVGPRNNLPKIKNGTYVKNLDEFKSIGTQRIALYVNSNNIIYFDSFGVEHIPKEIKKFIRNKNIIKKYL